MDARLTQADRAARLDPHDPIAQRAAQAERERTLAGERDEVQRRARWDRLLQIRRAADEQNVLRGDMPARLLAELDAQYEAAEKSAAGANKRLAEEGLEGSIQLVGDGCDSWLLEFRDEGAIEDVRYDHEAHADEWAGTLIEAREHRIQEADREEAEQRLVDEEIQRGWNEMWG